MSDHNLYMRSKAADIQAEYNAYNKSRPPITILKKIVVNMTMGNNSIHTLMPIVIELLLKYQEDMQIKQLAYLFITTYYPYHPDDVISILPLLKSNADDPLSIKTLSQINLPEFNKTLQSIINDSWTNLTPVKINSIVRIISDLPKKEAIEWVTRLNSLLSSSDPSILYAAINCLNDLTSTTAYPYLKIDLSLDQVLCIISSLSKAESFMHAPMISFLTNYKIFKQSLSDDIITCLIPYLQSNYPPTTLNTLKTIVYYANFTEFTETLSDKLIQAITYLLETTPTTFQFLILRNTILLLLTHPTKFNFQPSLFYISRTDPVYIKDTKLEILYLLSTPESTNSIISELTNYASDVDIHLSLKSIRTVGNLAIKNPENIPLLSKMIDTLGPQLTLNPLFPVIRDIQRKFKNEYKPLLFKCIDLSKIAFMNNEFDKWDMESINSFIWLIGEFPQPELLDSLWSYVKTKQVVIPTFLTTIVKTYVAESTIGLLLEKILNETSDTNTYNLDIIDRSSMYKNLLSKCSKIQISEIVCQANYSIVNEEDTLSKEVLYELECEMGSLASIYLRPINNVFKNARVKKMAK